MKFKFETATALWLRDNYKLFSSLNLLILKRLDSIYRILVSANKSIKAWNKLQFQFTKLFPISTIGLPLKRANQNKPEKAVTTNSLLQFPNEITLNFWFKHFVKKYTQHPYFKIYFAQVEKNIQNKFYACYCLSRVFSSTQFLWGTAFCHVDSGLI